METFEGMAEGSEVARDSLCLAQFHRALEEAAAASRALMDDRISAPLVLWPSPQICLFNLAPMNVYVIIATQLLSSSIYFPSSSNLPPVRGSIVFSYRMPLALVLSA